MPLAGTRSVPIHGAVGPHAVEDVGLAGVLTDVYRVMHITAMGFAVGVLLIVEGVGAQGTAVQGGPPTCGAPAGGACAPASGVDPSSSDLTPTQWLFGRDQFTKLVGTPATALEEAAGRMQWTSAFAGADQSRPGTSPRGKPASPTAGAKSDAVDAPDSGRGSPDTQRFLIEEWRRAELGVADSVYHRALQGIVGTFDSAQRAHTQDPARTRLLQRLDGLLAVHNYTWSVFRAQIMRRADSALVDLTPSGVH
jgi:hypothetical protein